MRITKKMKLFKSYRYHTFAARATLFPDKSIEEVQEIIEKNVADMRLNALYDLDNEYRENQEVKKCKCVVWENRKNGTRFMTPCIKGNTYEDNEHHIVIGTDLRHEDALILVKIKEDLNIASFLDNIPKELRNPETNAFIAALIRNGSNKE
jgi:hypothetical protein